MKSACVTIHRWPLLAAVSLLLTTNIRSAQPADWPHPRGPFLNGVVPDGALAAEWPKGGPPVLWRRSLGQGFSGFIIVAGRFYTQFQNAAGQFVGCFDLDSGREIWRTRYALPWQLDGDWPGPYATPVHASGRIYFAGCFGNVGCVRASDGKRLWSIHLPERFAGRGTEFGYSCAPLVDAGRVYLPVGGKGASVVALDASTGERLWKSGSDPASYCGSLAITVEGRRQIVSYLENITVAHDPTTGAELWRHTRGHGYAEHAAWPVWSPPFLFYAEPFREGAHVLRLDYTNDGPRMTEVWHSDVLCNDIFSSVIVDGHVYGFDILDYQAVHGGESAGAFKCIELATGVEKWAATNTGHAMVLADRTNLIIFNERGELILADANPTAYRERNRARVFDGIQCWVAPAYYDGRLLLRAKTNMACVYLGTSDPARLGQLRNLASVDLNPRPGRLGVFERYRSDAFFAPTLREMNEWFWISLVGVLLPVGLLARLARQWMEANHVLLIGSVLGGVMACPFYTGMLERLAFTWPLAVHGIYFATAAACLGAVHRPSNRSTWIARSALLGLATACLVYHFICQRHFLVMGWGFLVGILPALPVTLLLLNVLKRQQQTPMGMPSLLFSWLASFAVFYWSAAAFIHWRT